MKKGFQTGLLIELVYSIGLFAVIWGLAWQIMTLFAEDGDAQVVSLGISYLHLISWMYILPGMTNGIQGFFRGIGDLKVTLYSTFMNMLGRVVAVFVMLRLLHMDFVSLAWANMIGWIVMLLFEIPLLVKSLRSGECG
jgi:Na+-driven multidrug efflux pump